MIQHSTFYTYIYESPVACANNVRAHVLRSVSDYVHTRVHTSPYT